MNSHPGLVHLRRSFAAMARLRIGQAALDLGQVPTACAALQESVANYRAIRAAPGAEYAMRLMVQARCPR